MVRSQLITSLLLFACGLAVAVDPQTPAEPAEHPARGVDSVRVDKVPTEAEWEHKTYSPDKKQFAIYFRVGWDEVISIHDAASGKQLRYMAGHGDEVVEFKFSDDGKLLGSRCINSGRVGWAVWDVATGKRLFRLPESIVSKPKDK